MERSEPPQLMAALLILSVLMVSIAVSSAYSISLMAAFAGGIVPVLALGVRKGQAPLELLKHCGDSLWRIRGLFMIITLMGISIAMWISSGAVAYLMQAGAGLTRGALFLPAAFLICALSSLCIGTALGTFSTIGLAFYGMGKSAGIPDPLLVGTLVSGVFLADRLAPMSGIVNLILSRSGLTYPEFFGHSWRRVAAVTAVCGGAYAVLGLLQPQASDTGAAVIGVMTADFTASPLLWLLPLLTFGLALRGVPTVWTLFAGVASGFAFTVLLQHESLTAALGYVLSGYADQAGVLKGGGILGIAEVLGIVAMAVVYNELLARTGITETLLTHLAGGIRTASGLKRRMGIFSMGLTSLTCDQTVGILLPLEALKPFQKAGRVQAAESAVLVADTGTLIAPLEFWNVNALVIMALTGVPAWQYGPWAIFCWLSPLFYLVSPMAVRKGENSDIMSGQKLPKEDVLE